MEKAMEEGKEEFIELNRKLFNLMGDFGLRALKSIQAAKSESLNPIQINEIVAKEIQAVIGTLSDPSFVDMVVQKAEHDFYQGDIQPLQI